MTDDPTLVTAADVADARERIDEVVHRTPLDTSSTFAELSGAAAVGLKLENMQRTGSFKIRGAYNKMSRLPPAERERGVVAASAGNHAQGVALAGELLGIDATIVVPEITPAAKREATRGYGADVVVHGDIYERSYERALDLADERGYAFVHPFDDADVIAGQGTVGVEIAEQFPGVDTVLVPVGGGGLIAGIAVAMADREPDARVVGVQPEGAAHAKPSLEAGEVRELPTVDTVADGIADTRLLELTFAHAAAHVDDVVSVTDEELAVAVTLLAERAKTVAEPAGAAPVAALLGDDVDVAGERVAAVVSGGNADLSAHAELTRTGLLSLDRLVRARLNLDDWPRSVETVASVVEGRGGELARLETAAPTVGDHPNRRPVVVEIEGSGRSHLESVLDALDDEDAADVVRRSFAGESP